MSASQASPSAAATGPRTALITGGTDGIGKATARGLLRDGWDVVVTGRNAARCEATVQELAADGSSGRVSSLTGDLSRMADVVGLARAFTASHARLDVLLLNANAITQTFTRTPEGFEANLAVGYLGRALLAWELEPVLVATPASQVLSVVGMNLARMDLASPPTERGFSSMKALGHWQWCIQVFAREWNRRMKPAMNTYMPGLVRTKILASEPQPMRVFVQLANRVMGIPVARSGEELAWAVGDVTQHGRRDGYYARTRFKGPRVLEERADDGARLWETSAALLAPWRTAR